MLSGMKHSAAAAAAVADALERGDQGREGMGKKFVKVWNESREASVGDMDIMEEGEVGD